MKQTQQNQQQDSFDVWAEIKRRRIMQRTIAKKLNRSQTAITFALQGKSPRLLARIVLYLERTSSKRAA